MPSSSMTAREAALAIQRIARTRFCRDTYSDKEQYLTAVHGRDSFSMTLRWMSEAETVSELTQRICEQSVCYAGPDVQLYVQDLGLQPSVTLSAAGVSPGSVVYFVSAKQSYDNVKQTQGQLVPRSTTPAVKPWTIVAAIAIALAAAALTSLHQAGSGGEILEFSVRTMSGTTLPAEVEDSATVSKLLAIIEQQHGTAYAADRHTLNYQGQRLDSHARLSQYPFRPPAGCKVRRDGRSIGCAPALHLIIKAVPMAMDMDTSVSMVTAAESSPETDLVRANGKPGTLYARCGGIFGVAAFADRCMDKWMADPTLNANGAVATWHARAQRCGFKFLVTQLLTVMTGGPQRYTGKDIATAHAHLRISTTEWASFMSIFYEVCEEFNLPKDDVDDLRTVLLSTEPDCVVDGNRKPQPPSQSSDGGGLVGFASWLAFGRSLYERIGGVYPIALFADRLVDALLADSRVNIPVDAQRRNEASLKYLFTELVCVISGGPEVLTAGNYDDARLLLPAPQMFFLLEAAKEASDHLGSGRLRMELVRLLSKSQNLIVDRNTLRKPHNVARARAEAVAQLGKRTGVPLLYVPRGGVVKIDFDSTAAQLEAVHLGLAKLGLKSVERTKVKTLADAASGHMLSAAVITARHAAPGAFVASRLRVFGDPRTLYGRTGGVFGLAGLADRLMDQWMRNPELNANEKVSQWHQSHQRSGFKFFVTQLMGYLTGGPQRYTGHAMDVAHRHLSISDHQWDAFMADMNLVLQQLRVEVDARDELRSLIGGFRAQIVSPQGESPWPDPRLSTRRPDGSSLYTQAGGVYPMARFVDLLVEQTLNEKRVVPLNKRTSGELTAAGLKFLVTELICSATGGAEIVTSKGFDDVKLGVEPKHWDTFVRTARVLAAKVWSGHPDVGESVLAALEEQQAELTIGMTSTDATGTSAGAVGRKKMRDAGFGHLEITAALSKSRGDADAALKLLLSGWAPQRSTHTHNDDDDDGEPTGRCAFSGAKGKASACPSGRAAQAAAKEQDPPEATRSGWWPFGSGNQGGGSSKAGTGHVGTRVLHNTLQRQLDELLVEDPELSCPITLLVFHEPVIASDGGIYEKAAVQRLMRNGGLSLINQEPLEEQLFRADEIASKVSVFLEQRAYDLLAFARDAHNDDQFLMCTTALERARDYVVQVQHDAPRLVAALADTYTDLGKQAPPLTTLLPSARIARVLQGQVQHAITIAKALRAEARKAQEAQKVEDEARKAKTVLFVVDVSYSMQEHIGQGTTRMQSATENLLRLFDEYIHDGDQVGLITFADTVKLDIELQKLSPKNRHGLRKQAKAACRTRGATAFYDALLTATTVIGNEGTSAEPRWVVALSDGEDNRSRRDLNAAVRAFHTGDYGDLLLIGAQLPHSMKLQMEKLADSTPSSMFLDASGGLESLDDAFDAVAELITE